MENTLNKCRKRLSVLCYVCGLFTPKPKQVQLKNNSKIKEWYKRHFRIAVHKDCIYVPGQICINCYTMLREQRKHRNVPSSPMMWERPDEDHSNCYACLIPSLVGFKWSTRKYIKYPEFPTTNSKQPVYDKEQPAIELDRPLTESLPDPVRSNPVPLTSMSSLSSQSSIEDRDEDYIPPSKKKVAAPLKPFGQPSFNDLVRAIKIPPKTAELLGSRLQERNFVNANITYLRTETSFSDKFSNTEFTMTITIKEEVEDLETGRVLKVTKEKVVSNTLSYCNDVHGLFHLFQHEHKPEEWRLFLDGSSTSLKAVLLHNGNQRPSVPLAFSRHCPEKYETMQKILQHIGYDHFKWDTVVDYKLINILLGQMAAASKFPCIFCLWDAKVNKLSYDVKQYPERPEWSDSLPVRYNATKPPLIERQKVILPPLHVKIGLLTQLLKKVFKENSRAAATLISIFPRLSKEKIKGGIFDGPQIRKLFNDKNFPNVLSPLEKDAFFSVKAVVENFLGNHRSKDYKKLVEKLRLSFKKLNINITIKIHSLLCHLDKFKESCGDFSDEQGERFHQDFKSIERDYNGKNMANGLGLYCHRLIRERDPQRHKRKEAYGRKMDYFLVSTD